MRKKQPTNNDNTHRFGGEWTNAKLNVLAGYLCSYTTALKGKPTKKQPFRKAYIDAFADTGYREIRPKEDDNSVQNLSFPDLADAEPQALLDGSARLALKTEPRFDKYIFIEQSAKWCTQLEELKDEFPALAKDIDIRQGEANQQIQKICGTNWNGHRAVLFLDPYGMQVEWKTIEAVANTKAIDLWLLFPLGIGVNRLLTRSGEIPDSWRMRLNTLLGTDDWYEQFYSIETLPTLFGDESERVVKASTESIGQYFVDRLKTIFAGVAESPGVLRNSANNPLYLLCFAAGNIRGSKVALRIANHLLKELR